MVAPPLRPPQLFNKTATRLGEAHFFHFLPVPQGGDYAWAMDKCVRQGEGARDDRTRLLLPLGDRLGSWVDPLDAVENGSVHVHAVGSGVIYRSTSSPATRFFAIDTLDAPIVNPATAAQPATMFPVPLSPLTGPVLGFDVELMQNGTLGKKSCGDVRRVGAVGGCLQRVAISPHLPYVCSVQHEYSAVYVGPCVPLPLCSAGVTGVERADGSPHDLPGCVALLGAGGAC